MRQRQPIMRLWVLGAALLTVSAIAGAGPIAVMVNGERVRFQGMGPQEVNGRVLVPLRGVLEQMGATVDWDQNTRTVLATRNSTNVELPVGSHSARVNGRIIDLDVPAMIMEGTTMVPLRFVSEAFGADVRWDAPIQTVMVDTNSFSMPPSETIRPPTEPSRPPAEPGRPHISRGRRIVLAAGTVIPVTLDSSLSSKTSVNGDRFTAIVRSGSDNAEVPDGTRVEGVVRDAVASRGNKPGILDMEFRRIVFPNGDTQSIDGSLFSLDNNSVERSGGRLVAKSGKSKDTLKWVGIGAGAGLILSKVVKGNTLFDTLLGAGAGYLYDQLQGKKAGDVALKPGQEFGVRLDTDLAFRVMDSNYDDSVRPNRIP